MSLLDEAALSEGNGGDQSGDARPDADGLNGLEAAGEFIPFGDVAADGRRGGDLWQRGRRLLAVDLRAGGKGGTDEKGSRE